MSKLLSSLDKPETKKAYQTYTIQHGIEKFGILVPLAEAALFESEFASSGKSKAVIVELVKKHGGRIKDGGR